MTRQPNDDDRCLECGSDELWSQYFDKDGFGTTDGTGVYKTICMVCGAEWKPSQFYAAGRDRRNRLVKSGPFMSADAAQRWADFKYLSQVTIEREEGQ
jgi:hypothetical protein